jgi:hypothetical protein
MGEIEDALIIMTTTSAPNEPIGGRFGDAVMNPTLKFARTAYKAIGNLPSRSTASSQ